MRFVLCRVTGAVFLLATASVFAAGPVENAAIPLRNPAVETPIDTAGSGLAPEVTVRVVVDARGRVGEVEILNIDPRSEFDELFEEVTRKTLSSWRYAPQIKDGRPVEIELRWTIQFPSREKEQEQPAVSRRIWRSATEGGRPEDLWKKILSMSHERRVKLLEESAVRAKRHLNAETATSFSSPRFVVQTDASRPETAKTLAGNLEATFNVVHGLLQPVVDPQPERFKVLAFLYESRNAFGALRREVMNVDWAGGFYSPAGIIAFHMNMPTNESLVSLMLHEATHAYMDRHVARPGVLVPRWLGEGFAEYVGNSTIRKGRLIPGRTPRSQIYRSRLGLEVGQSEPAYSVDQVKQMMRTGKALTVDQIVSGDPATFYGEGHRMYYTMSWLFVHYLRHGREGWAEREFPTFVLYVAEGYPPSEAFQTVYGFTPSEAEAEFHGYVKKF